MKSICFPPTAFEAPQVRRAGPALRLLTADCLLPTSIASEGGGMERVLRRDASPGQDVTSDSERKN